MGVFAFNCWYWLGDIKSRWPFTDKKNYKYREVKVNYNSYEEIEL